MRLFKGPCHYGRELPDHPFGFRELVTRALIVVQREFFCKRLKTHRQKFIDFAATDVDAVQRLLSDELEKPGGRLIARYGTGELETTLRGIDIRAPHPLLKLFGLLTGGNGPFWWDNSIRSGIHWIAGVFPPTDETMMAFSRLVEEDSKCIDILAGGRAPGEEFMRRTYFPNGVGIPSDYLLRPDSPNSWTHRLKGKSVLVVSPFDVSIRAQYARRTELFAASDTLPEFELLTYRSVVSFGGEFANTSFTDWFEALRKMEDDISKINFDIALISAGAYGMNLGAHVKRMGKKAIHLGGILQALFGLKFRGTDEVPYWRGLYTPAWTRPLESERPQNYKTIENGSYW